MVGKRKKEKADFTAMKNGENEPVLLQGLVVEWTLPSRESLVDWIRSTVEDVRVKEVVELFPKEIFDELESIRRSFYYKVEKLCIPAYSLKILPIEALPKFQEAVEEVRKALKGLDEKIKAAMKDEYTKKAVSYFVQKAEAKPRMVEGISGRFNVSMMPLRVDRLVWTEFLNDTLKKDLDRLNQIYQEEKARLFDELSQIRQQIEEAQKELEGKKSELAEAEEAVKQAYEPIAAPVDVALLRTEKAELESKIKSLRARARELEMRVQQLEREQQERQSRIASAYTWARQQTEQTERRIRFDAYAVFRQQLNELIAEALRVLEEDEKVRARELKRLITVTRNAMERVRSVMPASRMADYYERLLIAVKEGADGNYADAKNMIESIRREI